MRVSRYALAVLAAGALVVPFAGSAVASPVFAACETGTCSGSGSGDGSGHHDGHPVGSPGHACPGEVGVGVVGLPVRIGGCAPLPTPGHSVHLPLPGVHVGGHHPVTVVGVTPGAATDCGCTTTAPPVTVVQPPVTVEQPPATVVQQAPPVTVQAPSQEQDTVTAPAPEAPVEAPAPSEGFTQVQEVPSGPVETGDGSLHTLVSN